VLAGENRRNDRSISDVCCGVGGLVGLLALAGRCARPKRKVSLVIGYPPGAVYDGLWAVGGALHRQASARQSDGRGGRTCRAPAVSAPPIISTMLRQKDGSTIGLVRARPLRCRPLFDNQGIQFDAPQISIGLGSHQAPEVSVVAGGRPQSRFKSIADAQKTEMILAASGSGARQRDLPLRAQWRSLEPNSKVVTGYPRQWPTCCWLSSAARSMAMAPTFLGQPRGGGGPTGLRDRKVQCAPSTGNQETFVTLRLFRWPPNSPKNEGDPKSPRPYLFAPGHGPIRLSRRPNVPLARGLRPCRAAFAATMKDPEFFGRSVPAETWRLIRFSADEVTAVVRKGLYDARRCGGHAPEPCSEAGGAAQR